MNCRNRRKRIIENTDMSILVKSEKLFNDPVDAFVGRETESSVLIVSKNSSTLYITPFDKYKKFPPTINVKVISTFDPFKIITEEIVNKKPKKIGINFLGFPKQALEILAWHLQEYGIEEDVIFCDISKEIYEAYLEKSEKEIRRMAFLRRCIEDVFNDVLKFIESGKSEAKVYGYIGYLLSSYYNVEMHNSTVVAFDENTIDIHHRPSVKRNAKEVCIVDIVAKEKKGLYADASKTILLKNDKEIVAMYDAVNEAFDAALKMLKPGEDLENVQKEAHEILEKYGFKKSSFFHFHKLYHSIGYELHETIPSQTKLKENMVICVEPAIYDEERKIGIRIEEPVVICKYGAKTLLELGNRLFC